MNRIVLIGNGFDLAHKLPTRYEDFLVWYFEDAAEKAWKKQDKVNKLVNVADPYNDELIVVTCDVSYFVSNDFNKEKFCNHTSLKDMEQRGYYRLRNKFRGGIAVFDIDVTSDFLKRLLVSDKNWADIEGEYFKALTKIYTSETLVKTLNEDFAFIKEKFQEYISMINSSVDCVGKRRDADKVIKYCFSPIGSYDWARNFNKPFKRWVSRTNMRNSSILGELKKFNNTYFINFNYTSMLNKHLQGFGGRDTKFKEIHIHGAIHPNPGDGVIGDIIFGYGDDTHKLYKELEQDGNNELLAHMKSFYYSDEDHYLEVLDILDGKQPYEVVVVGHSMGLSDRVLLKTIFEHENCIAIRLLHRGSKPNHIQKRIALSRHMDDKLEMRGKIVPYSASDVFGKPEEKIEDIK